MVVRVARRTLILSLVLPAFLCGVIPAHAQLGGLIKKKVAEATGKKAETGAPDVYSDILLELTEDRLVKVIAGKRAGKQFANGPRGAAALRARWQETEDRWQDLSNKNSKVLNAWTSKSGDIMACRDSAFTEARQRQKAAFGQRAPTDQALIQKMLALSQALQAAQEKGDTALVRKLGQQVKALSDPPATPADSAAATRACGDLANAPAIYVQVQALYEEKESLKDQMQKAESEVTRLEQEASGMTEKQLAIACERIKAFLDRLKKKVAQGGFSEKELAALQQHIKDLEALCD